MEAIPDLSFFAMPEFFVEMQNRPVRTRSLILLSDEHPEWEQMLTDVQGGMYSWLHEKTGHHHDVFLPMTVNQGFLKYHGDHMSDLVAPGQRRIRKYLEALGVTDVDEYMKDSDEWLPVLFAGRDEHYQAAQMAARTFSAQSMPSIILWTSFEAQSVVIITPHPQHINLPSYLKAIYWAILTAAEELRLEDREAAQKLVAAIQMKLQRAKYYTGPEPRLQGIRVQYLHQSVGERLRAVGEEYTRQFQNAIGAFEEATEALKQPSASSIQGFTAMKARDVRNQLQTAGYSLQREGAEHEMWGHPKVAKLIAVPRHQKISPFVVDRIRDHIAMTETAI